MTNTVPVLLMVVSWSCWVCSRISTSADCPAYECNMSRKISRVDFLLLARTYFFFQAEDGIRDHCVTGVQTCALPILNFGEILDSGKILICNLAEGKLGEDTSQLLGTMVLAKLQQAAFRRSQMNVKIRKPFYLYIDEFQNFATSSFTKILSGGRKFGLRITVAEQSTTQQDDRNVTNTILANTGTVICFRTASPIDEDLMLTQFRPLVEKGAIVNLPRFHF